MPRKLLNKDFVLLWLGQSVSQLGNGAGFIAIMWWIQTTTGSALALGTVAMIKTLVAVLLSPFAGVVADRINRKAIIVVTDLVQGLVYCSLAWAVWTDNLSLPILFAVSVVTAACGQFFHPSISASIPQLVPKEQLEKANSLRQVTDNIVRIASYGVGGVLVALLGIPMLLLVDGISFLLSAVSELFIIIPVVTKRADLNFRLFWSDLKGGMDYIRGNRVLVGVMKVMLVLNFAFVPQFLLLPKFVAEHLNAGSAVYGYISSANTIGMLLGTLAITLADFAKRNYWSVRWGIGIMSLSLIAAPLVPGEYWWAHLILYGIFGFFNCVINICFYSTLQRSIDPHHMGKVFSFVMAAGLGLQPLASGLFGILADHISLTVIFIGASTLGLLSNIGMMSIPGIHESLGIRKMKELEDRQAPATA